MSIKHHKPSRQILTVLAIAFTGSALMAACSKNPREKIDLSNIQTTTAAESGIPETIQLSASAPSAGPETSAPSVGSSTGSAGGSSSAVNNISTKINTYVSGRISIEYPSVTNMDDRSKAASIDTLMKDNALSILDAYDLDETQDTLTIQCRVLSADRSRITATYTGTCMKKDAAFPVNIFYSNTIDVGKADNIGLGEFADPYTMAGYVLSDDCQFYDTSPELAAELMAYKNNSTLEAYTNLFNRADFPVRDTFPESFSYEHEGAIFFSIPVPHALGDYAIVVYVPDTK